jgi:hypothetical protein
VAAVPKVPKHKLKKNGVKNKNGRKILKMERQRKVGRRKEMK